MNNYQETHQALKVILSSIMPTYSEDYWQATTEIFGALPEFDSMAIVTLIGELEDQLEVELDDDDITAENFETLESIIQLILKS